MRSSCEASAMNAAQPVLARLALGERLLEAVEHRLSAIPSRPTSVRGSVASTRCERSPPAIAPAVWPDAVEREQADPHDDPAGERRARAARRRSRAPRRAAGGPASRRPRAAGPRRSWIPPLRGSRCGEHAVAAVVAGQTVTRLAQRQVSGQVGLAVIARADGQRRPITSCRDAVAPLAVGAGGRAELARRRRPPGRRPVAGAVVAAAARRARGRRPNGASRACSSTRSSRNERCSA